MRDNERNEGPSNKMIERSIESLLFIDIHLKGK